LVLHAENPGTGQGLVAPAELHEDWFHDAADLTGGGVPFLMGETYTITYILIQFDI